MLAPFYTKQFQKDLKKMLRQGRDKEKIKIIVSRLISKEKLDKKDKDHKLTGNYKGRRECHIEPD
ncbi:MAG: type II toxin-antitoxin system mRNA interferase toxin, RelE/StbE family [Desulfococcaceae bacterium]|jgi:mRNA interferase YafQ|nr:type II toxin-antitoxin system mRNA interferase toxin, RelE/StbE family [Desulfococcaceae bacterium]